MNETSKLLRTWGPTEMALLAGSGIDIGCGPDPVTPTARGFDVQDGDANHITRYVSERFDFVFSSHCLEHMRDPRAALLEWWELVKPGGHLIFTVPDEDLYEQGVFPSRFNADHKFTFTISKARSWSPVSINVLDLAHALPEGRLVSLVLQDQNYDRRLLRHGPLPKPPRWLRRLADAWPPLGRLLQPYRVVDQSLRPDVLGQIQCIVRKCGPAGS